MHYLNIRSVSTTCPVKVENHLAANEINFKFYTRRTNRAWRQHKHIFSYSICFATVLRRDQKEWNQIQGRLSGLYGCLVCLVCASECKFIIWLIKQSIIIYNLNVLKCTMYVLTNHTRIHLDTFFSANIIRTCVIKSNCLNEFIIYK